MNKQQAARNVYDAVTAVEFDLDSASSIARKLFPGVENDGLKRKVRELLITLVQQHLNLSDEAVLNFGTQRTAVEHRFASLTEVPEQAGVAATEHLTLRKDALKDARANLYTAIMSHDQSGTREAQAAFRSAEAAVAQAVEELRLAQQQIATAKTRRATEQEELARQLMSFDERNAVVAAFIEWRDNLKVELKPEAPAPVPFPGPIPAAFRRGGSRPLI